MIRLLASLYVFVAITIVVFGLLEQRNYWERDVVTPIVMGIAWPVMAVIALLFYVDRTAS
jgi:hypothetical protein